MRQKRNRSTLRFRPTFEILEERCVPTARIWTGDGANDLWSNPANWDGGLTTPANGDDVIIPDTASSLEVVLDGSVSGGITLNRLTSDEPFRIAGGTLRLDGPGTFHLSQTLTLLSGGVLEGSGVVTVSGLTTWSSGIMRGSGVTNANGGLTLSGNLTLSETRTLNNPAAATYNGVGNNFFSNGAGAVFNNLASGTFTITGNNDFFQGTFNNQGTFLKQAGASGDGITRFTSSFNNSGTVDVQSGTLQLAGGGTHTGDFDFTGAVFHLGGGTHQFNAGADMTGTTFVAVSGVNNFNAGSSYNVTASSTFSNGPTTFNGSVVAVGDSVTINGGVANFNQDVSTTTLNLLTGNLSGSGTVNVSGLTTWSGGIMQGSGVTNANGGLTLTGNLVIGETRRVNNAAAATYNGVGSNFFSNSLGAVFNNLASGTFTIIGNNDFFQGTFNNLGTFLKQAGASGDGITRFTSSFNNSGTVDVQSGTLQLAGGGTHTGDFDFTGAVFHLGGGTHQFNAGADVTGTTFVAVTGVNNFNAGSSYNVTASSTFSNGPTTFNGSVVAVGDTVTINGGVANFNQDVSTTTLNLLTGNLSGSGTVNVSGLTTWSGGMMQGSGVTNANGGLTLTGNLVLSETRTLNNAAAATYNGVGNNFFTNGLGGVFNNLATGTFTITGNNDFFQGTFNNLGTFLKQAGASGDGVTRFTSSFSNSGTVDIQGGMVQLDGTFTNFNSTVKTLSGGAYLVAGVLRFTNANIVTNNATIVLRGATSQIINQTGSSGIAGFTSNTTAASFTLEDRNLSTNAADAIFTNAGDMTFDAGTFTIASGGQYRQTGGSTALVDGGLTASTVKIEAGTLRGDGTVTGSIQNTGGTVMPGFSAGIISVTGDYSQTTGGTLAVDIAGRAPAGGGVAGVDFDRLDVGGTTTLSGAVNISVLGPFVPVAGDDYPIILSGVGASGAFSLVNGSQINTEGLFFDPEYTASSFNFIVSRLDAGSDRNVDEASLFELLAAFADPGAGDSYAATIDWGDGSPVEDGAVLPGKYVSASHTYADNGVFAVTVRLLGDDGSRATDVFILTVDNVPPTADAGGPYDVLEVGTVKLSGTGSDVAGEHDPLTFTWDLDGDHIFGETGQNATRGDEVGTSPTFNAASLDGPSTVVVTLRVNDGDGGTTDATAAINVLNVAPTADAGGPYEVVAGETVQLSGTGSDVAGEHDPLTFTWDLDGDNIFGETGQDAARGDEVGTSPTFNAASVDGPSTVVVTVRVNDGDGGITEDTATINVLAPQATEETWTGASAVSSFWSDPANWAGNRVPKAGRHLIFPARAGRFTTINDLPADTEFASITLEGPGYELRGNRVRLGAGGFAASGGRHTVALDASLVDSPHRLIRIGHGAELDVSGSISGTGGLRKEGTGRLSLGGGNTFTGETEVLEGTLNIRHSMALGSSAGQTKLRGGTSLVLENNIRVQDDLTLVGDPPGAEFPGVTVFSHGSNAIGDEDPHTPPPRIALNPFLTVTVVDGTLTVNGVMSGEDNMAKDGAGTLILNADNILTGVITLRDGTLLVNGSQPNTPIIVAGGTLGGTGLLGPITLNGGQIQGVVMQASPIQPGQIDVVAGGTPANDTIQFSPGVTPGTVEVFLNGLSQGTFSPTGRLIAYALAGDDDVQVDGSLTYSAWLYAGAGNDRLKGGAGHDVLLGGAGDDLLIGGTGRDFLIGGVGADRINGNSGDDVIVAGYTEFDADVHALARVMAEWTSARSYETRVRNLTDGTGSADRQNGAYFLKAGDTVQDDGDIDVLTGAAGLDWFFYDRERDQVTD